MLPYGKRGYGKEYCQNRKNIGKEDCVASVSKEEDILVRKVIISSNGGNLFHDRCIMNLGVTWHITLHRDWFYTCEPILDGSMFMRNHHALKIIGNDIVKIKMNNDIVYTLQIVQ